MSVDKCIYMWKKVSRWAVPHSLWAPWIVPARLLCSQNSPGKDTGVGGHALLQGIFPPQGSNPGLLSVGGFLTVWATKEVSVVNEGPDTTSAPLLWNSDLCYLNRECMAFSFLFLKRKIKSILDLNNFVLFLSARKMWVFAPLIFYNCISFRCTVG